MTKSFLTISWHIFNNRIVSKSAAESPNRKKPPSAVDICNSTDYTLTGKTSKRCKYVIDLSIFISHRIMDKRDNLVGTCWKAILWTIKPYLLCYFYLFQSDGQKYVDPSYEIYLLRLSTNACVERLIIL